MKKQKITSQDRLINHIRDKAKEGQAIDYFETIWNNNPETKGKTTIKKMMWEAYQYGLKRSEDIKQNQLADHFQAGVKEGICVTTYPLAFRKGKEEGIQQEQDKIIEMIEEMINVRMNTQICYREIGSLKMLIQQIQSQGTKSGNSELQSIANAKGISKSVDSSPDTRKGEEKFHKKGCYGMFYDENGRCIKCGVQIQEEKNNEKNKLKKSY